MYKKITFDFSIQLKSSIKSPNINENFPPYNYSYKFTKVSSYTVYKISYPIY